MNIHWKPADDSVRYSENCKSVSVLSFNIRSSDVFSYPTSLNASTVS